MQIYLTSDFFFEPNGTFWICLQPHVKIAAQPDMDTLMASLGKSANFQYTLWQRNADTTGLVPVPFPSDADLFLKLGGAGPGFEMRSNLRTKAVVLNKQGWLDFEKANRDAGERMERSGNSTSPVMAEGAFAPIYNQSLQTTWVDLLKEAQTDNRVDPVNHMCQMLTMAFWGGTRRRMPMGVATGLDKIGIMTLQEIVPPDVASADTITNLHSLAGLMFRIGAKADTASLTSVVDLELDIDDGSGPKSVLKFSDLDWAKPTVKAFFSSLANPLPATGQSSLWNTDFGKRVYVSDGMTSFAPQLMGGQLWFRRKQEDSTTPRHPGGASLRSLTVRFRGDVPQPPAQLTLSLYDSFDVVFTKYGNVRPGPDGILLQLRPRIDERTAFYDEVNRQLKADATWFNATNPNRPRFYDSSGTERQFSFVGSYSLPWVAEGNALLFYGPSMDPSDALMLFPRITLPPLIKKGDDPKTDPFGLRYQWESATGAGDFRFDTLLVAGAPAGSDRAMILGANFAGQLQFDPAQSVSNIEGNLEVKYPAPVDPPDKNSINASDEYLHDLLNYNTLNVFAKYPGAASLVHLNPATELFPVYSVKPANQTVEPKDHYSAYFHFRYTQPVIPADPKDAAKFFANLYGRMAQTVELGFNIEHTYGLTIPLAAQGTIASFVNYPPVLPNELTLSGNAAKKLAAADPDLQDQHFCTISLVQRQDGDQLSLTFRPNWLSPEWAADPDLGPFSVAAWRSVAEMANAAGIALSGKFLSFDFRAALVNSTDDVLAQGFVNVPAFDTWKVDLTPTLRAAAAQWLKDAKMGKPLDPIPLAGENGLRVGAACTIVEFDLSLARPAVVLPPSATASLAFVRPAATVGAGAAGQAMVPVAASEIEGPYTAWLEGLASKLAPISPQLTQDEKQYALDLRSLLGATERESGAWIAPHSLAGPSGQAIPSICPASFRPLMRHPLLGDGTYQTVASYFWALDVVLRGAVQESAQMRVPEWKAYFDSLQARVADLVSLTDRMVAMAMPAPNGKSALLDPEVASCVSDLGGASPEALSFKTWLKSEIQAAPAIFGDSKAFLYTRLKGNGANGLLPKEFARLNFTKLLKREEITLAKPVSQQATDADRFLLWESLRDLKDRPGFGFAETLDNLRYRDDFEVREFSLSSLEGLVEKLRSPSPDAPEPDNVMLVDGKVHIPAGAFVPGDKDVLVKLPSREPVTAPVHHFTGFILDCQSKDGFNTAAAGALVRDNLLTGSVTAVPQSGDPAMPIACTVGRPASTFARPADALDQYVLSAVFSIRGDEEATTEWNHAFDNDRFHLRTDRLAAATPRSGGKPEDFISSLMKTISPDMLPGLHDSVLKPETVNFFSQAMQPATPPDNIAEITALPYLEISASDTGAVLSFKYADGTNVQGIEAYLLKTGVASAGCAAPPDGSSMILLINFQASIWTSSWVCLQQTRNLLSGQNQVHFAKEFATVAALAGPQDGVQSVVTRDKSANVPKTLPRQKYTMAELVQKLLFDTKLLKPEVTGDQWRRFDLTVTFHARQQLTQWTVYVDETGALQDERETVEHSSLAERSFTGRGQTGEFDSPLEWAIKDIDDYFVDFHWSSGWNVPFFRIDHVPAKFN